MLRNLILAGALVVGLAAVGTQSADARPVRAAVRGTAVGVRVAVPPYGNRYYGGGYRSYYGGGYRPYNYGGYYGGGYRPYYGAYYRPAPSVYVAPRVYVGRPVYTPYYR